jgi:lipoprotein-anchoring transpeptidase ErfK/SrfK
MPRFSSVFLSATAAAGVFVVLCGPSLAQDYYYPPPAGSYGVPPYPDDPGAGDAPYYAQPRARPPRNIPQASRQQPAYADPNDQDDAYDYPPPQSAPRGRRAPATADYDDDQQPEQPMQLSPRGGRTRTASLPPDADPAYSSAQNYDSEVDSSEVTHELVADPTHQQAGTITIDTHTKKLYLSLGGGRAMQYGIGVGREGYAWKGTAMIGRKAVWPGWTPPSDMLKRRPDLPRHMEGGMDNPLGARALYLFQGNKDTLFRIHGTNEPDTIGRAVSSGCIRMMNADVMDLYQRVPKGARVVVL